ILGLLGVAVLSHILDNDRYYRSRPVARSEPLPEYRRSTHRPAPYLRMNKTAGADRTPIYGSHEGWQALDNNEPGKAMQIFAVQSQQNLHSGVPKVGFALAAASKGELERGIWSMRKAVARDPGALDQVVIDADLHQLINDLSAKYQSEPATGTPGSYRSFMIAALSYLQRDIPTARTHIASADNSRSSHNLRSLIESAGN
ncbi:MAG: hypothetical protein R3318_03335, partial [Gammaproteobacteria bacterium]|nr:hypothetical protein [Gammaproteobacteria bacterium]